jgi:hypothetical protein
MPARSTGFSGSAFATGKIVMAAPVAAIRAFPSRDRKDVDDRNKSAHDVISFPRLSAL